MAWLLLGVVALAAGLGLLHILAAAPPRTLARALRYLVGGALVGAGAVMAYGGRWGIGIPLIAVGGSAMLRGRIGPLDLGGGSRSNGQGSVVRSAYLVMRLDHDSGNVEGEVTSGTFAGRELASMSPPELADLHAEISNDPDSLALFEVYLDRRMPGWREDIEEDAAPRTGGAPRSGAMSKEEAYQVLGLAPGAGEAEIRAAHHRLMKRVHPDQGGSNFLAAKINEAKDRLLGEHR